jgi:hypothetical protein
MHSNPHPKAGKSFRINIDDGKSPAGYDQMLHGSVFRLVDWADRMDEPSTMLSRQKENALTFYAHRCLPNLDSPDRESIPLGGLVYGFFETERKKGDVFRSIAVLRETELVDIE